MRVLVLLVLLLTVSLAPAWGEETAYVTDRFKITLRTGPGADRKILKMLPSGTEVTVLERNESGYARVRTAAGEEGWVLQRYLQDQPVARERLAEFSRRIPRLEEKIASLQQENATLKEENLHLKKVVEATKAARARVEAELARIREASRNVIALQEENERLKGEAASLRRDLLTLRQENAALQDVRQRDGFLAGALVLAGGIVAGLLLSRVSRRRRSSWSDL